MFASIRVIDQVSFFFFSIGSLGLRCFLPLTFVAGAVLTSFAMSFSLSPNKSSMFLSFKLGLFAFPRCTPTCPHPSRSSLIWPCEGLPKLQLLWTCSIIEVKITTISVAKVGASSLFIGAISKIDVLFARVVSTIGATCAKEGRGLIWGLWITSSLSK